MANIHHHRKKLISRLTDGVGFSSRQHRQEAFAAAGPIAAKSLIEKVSQHAHKITDEDIATAKAGGLTEDQIFELVVTAAVGQANRQLEAALAALDEATKG